MKLYLVSLAIVLLAGITGAMFFFSPTFAQHIVQIEWGWDRPGGDYTVFDIGSADPATCQGACVGDTRCLAFTYVAPGVQGLRPRCWLKNVVPPRVPNPCCASGVKFVVGQTADLEDDTNRFGKDYLELPSASPAACRNSCQVDGRCKAFTFVKASGACFLKNEIPPPSANVCCVSGMVR